VTAVIAGWVCLGAPLGGCALITLGGTRISRRAAGYLATLSTSVAFVAALVAFLTLLGQEPDERAHASTAWTWLSAGSYDFGLRILVDPLSVFMMLVVAGIGSLIVGYSIGYMDRSDEERRFFAYMALFVFSMLLLVEGGNYLMLLAGWGMVGLSSYLLIGYDQHRPSAIAAAKKAFIMNAFGDATMVLALFVLVQKTGSLDYEVVAARSDSLGGWAINLVALGLLGGAVAKSAQIPLQTWLPDAMEGPTPVSALIHAATMVTAGVYLIVRTHPLFEAAPTIQDLAAGLGAATLLLAGLIALVQVDIKRVIAYSTMSQIGYMFLGAGLGAYANGMFHLMTHAFFKALLFLAAGIAIHALSGEQDIRRMRGLGSLMPLTKWVFLIGSLALVGMPPFAGFFSKDSILAAATDAGWYGWVLFAAGQIGTFLTGLYTFRLYFLVFRGPAEADLRSRLHLHGGKEGPGWMTVPVLVLALGSIFAGWIQFAPFWTPITDWLAPVAEPLVEPTRSMELLASVLAVALGLAGILVAYLVYAAGRVAVPSMPFVRRTLEEKFWFDRLYDRIFYAPAVWTANALRGWIERPVIQGSLTEVARDATQVSGVVARLQTGFVRTYALAFASGLAVLAIVFISVR
jgi:NADH-quinone oxidoreductase subunit L